MYCLEAQLQSTLNLSIVGGNQKQWWITQIILQSSMWKKLQDLIQPYMAVKPVA